MERSPEPGPSEHRAPPAPECLGKLARALAAFPRLTCTMRAGGDPPVLDVTGPGGSTAVVVGSIHFWWIDGNGPIGRIRHVDLVAERIATRCGAAGPPTEHGRDHRADPDAPRPEGTALAAGPSGALVTT